MSGILILLYCPEKVPTLKQAPTLQFLQFSGFFEVLRGTARHAKFLRSKSEGTSAELT